MSFGSYLAFIYLSSAGDLFSPPALSEIPTSLILIPQSHATVGQESPSPWVAQMFCLCILVNPLRALKSFSLAVLDCSIVAGKPHGVESTVAIAGEIQEQTFPRSLASSQQDILLLQR